MHKCWFHTCATTADHAGTGGYASILINFLTTLIARSGRAHRARVRDREKSGRAHHFIYFWGRHIILSALVDLIVALVAIKVNQDDYHGDLC
jgi:hypothetical protein